MLCLDAFESLFEGLALVVELTPERAERDDCS